LSEDVESRYDTYIVRERAIKGEDLVRNSYFSTVGLNPMKILSHIFSCFQNRISDVFYSISLLARTVDNISSTVRE
jgi:hypothetical protein